MEGAPPDGNDHGNNNKGSGESEDGNEQFGEGEEPLAGFALDDAVHGILFVCFAFIFKPTNTIALLSKNASLVGVFLHDFELKRNHTKPIFVT